MFSFNSFVSKLALVCVQPQAINKLIGLESDMVFEGTTGVYERICPINSKRITKKE